MTGSKEGLMDNPNRANLCNPKRVLTDERYPGQEFRFTCADKADNKTTWACTGSEHKYGEHTICTCSCHVVKP
jgi:hypothetical protein